MGTWFSTPQIQSPGHHNKPFVRMCSSGTHFPNFADIGDTVILFVDFGQDCKPVTRENLDQALNGANPPIEEWKSPTQHHLDDEEEQPYEVNNELNEKHFKVEG